MSNQNPNQNPNQGQNQGNGQNWQNTVQNISNEMNNLRSQHPDVDFSQLDQYLNQLRQSQPAGQR